MTVEKSCGAVVYRAGGKLRPRQEELNALRWVSFEQALALFRFEDSKGILRQAREFLT